MALDLSRFKLDFLKRLDARSRVFVLVGAVLGVVIIIYLGTRYFVGGDNTTGPSRVATAPQGLQSIPGGTLTPEYYQALRQANVQARQQAQISGGSAIPTQINVGQQMTTGGCIICSDQSANVKTYLDDWARQGKISPDVAAALQQLADKNVSVEDYAAALDQLVKEGKLTPEQARALLEQYKKQHGNALLADSAKTMDALIKSGQLPLDAANLLLDSQKKGASTSDYAAQLDELARQGKISPSVAQQLLAQYTQQRAREVILKSIASLHKMARNGEITADVERELADLENRMVPLDTYAAALQKDVSGGKLTPVAAAKILDEFKAQKAEIGPTASIDQMLQKAEAAAYGEINDLMKAGKMPQDVGAQLTALIQKNVSLDDYKAVVNQFVQQKKITPEIGKLKIDDYQAVKGLRDMAQRLATLQGNNASNATYADELKRGVQAGILTPEQAAQLMQEYQAMTARAGVAPAATVPGTAEFAQLQSRVQQGVTPPPPVAEEFAQAQAQAATETAADRQARLDALMNAMSNQAQQLVSAWQPPAMLYREGSAEGGGGGRGGAGGKEELENGKVVKKTSSTTVETTTPPLIKAGTILFGVLDTGVNSDYPDSPVLVTIVEGKFKGAKLLGKITITKSNTGQMDRVSLNFTMMNLEAWPKSKSVTAYAIDPDTARTVLASSVNYHYMMRFGAMMATSFLQGYATSITNAGTSTTGIFGTSTTHPELSPTSKIAVGLGQVGQTLGQATQNYVNIPPTVVVDSGVGLGILFMSDVT